MRPSTTADIVVDVRERRGGVPDALSALGASLTFCTLEIADYDVGGDTLVERKTTRDLHLSIVKGRFWEQIGAVRRHSRSPVLLVEGRRIDDGPLRRSSIRGALLAVADLGVAVIRSEGPNDSALWLRQLALRRSGRAARSDRPTYSQRPKAHRNPREAALSAIPGVSTTIARALLWHFGSVGRVASASVDELQVIPGIGQLKALAIFNTLRR